MKSRAHFPETQKQSWSDKLLAVRSFWCASVTNESSLPFLTKRAPTDLESIRALQVAVYTFKWCCNFCWKRSRRRGKHLNVQLTSSLSHGLGTNSHRTLPRIRCQFLTCKVITLWHSHTLGEKIDVQTVASSKLRLFNENSFQKVPGAFPTLKIMLSSFQYWLAKFWKWTPRWYFDANNAIIFSFRFST